MEIQLLYNSHMTHCWRIHTLGTLKMCSIYRRAFEKLNRKDEDLCYNRAD